MDRLDPRLYITQAERALARWQVSAIKARLPYRVMAERMFRMLGGRRLTELDERRIEVAFVAETLRQEEMLGWSSADDRERLHYASRACWMRWLHATGRLNDGRE